VAGKAQVVALQAQVARRHHRTEKWQQMIPLQGPRQHRIRKDQGQSLVPWIVGQHRLNDLRRAVDRGWPGGIKAQGNPLRRDTLQRAAQICDRDWP
jgi:hypothetical protein